MKIEVPIYINHDMTEVIGTAKIEEDLLPPTPNFCFSLGYVGEEWVEGKVTRYKLFEISVVDDQSYFKYLQKALNE